MKTRFSLAPMAPSIMVLTVILWLLPLFFLGYFFLTGFKIIGMVSLFLFFLYGAVWLLCRPRGFELVDDVMKVVFPAWARTVPLQDIRDIQQIGAGEFKKRYGWAMRIGVGGLWGGFGWLWTSKGGLVEFYVSRFDRLVMIERKEARSMLLTPSDPAGFATAVQKALK